MTIIRFIMIFIQLGTYCWSLHNLAEYPGSIPFDAEDEWSNSTIHSGVRVQELCVYYANCVFHIQFHTHLWTRLIKENIYIYMSNYSDLIRDVVKYA